tara:strand:- start:594 stop:1991 length:1398 start_codon:yes stop_codon:yes gene_type:complete
MEVIDRNIADGTMKKSLNKPLSKNEISTLLDVDNNILKENQLIDNGSINLLDLNILIKRRNKIYNFSNAQPKKTSPHHNRIKSNGLNVLDMYCGAGGLSSGFEQSGYNIIAGIEYIPIYAKTHEYNFPKSLSICGDINELKIDDINDKITENIDIIIGGPPCQTFSALSKGKLKSLGRNIKDDIRNYQYINFIKYVNYFKPKAFLMENVPGFKTQSNGKIFSDFIEHFNNSEYNLTHKILSAEGYGVPQNRKRLFIVGIRGDKHFDFPEIEYLNNEKSTLFEQNAKKAITVKEAIDDLPIINDDWRISKMKYSKFNNLSDYQKLIRNNTNYVYNNICRISNDDAKEAFKHIKPEQRLINISKAEYNKLKLTKIFKSKIIYNRIRRLPINKPSWTIIAHIGIDGYEYIHPYENRTLSVREAARLQSFPDDFIFMGNMREQYLQVGNAVPPLLAKKIASRIHKTLNN